MDYRRQHRKEALDWLRENFSDAIKQSQKSDVEYCLRLAAGNEKFMLGDLHSMILSEPKAFILDTRNGNGGKGGINIDLGREVKEALLTFDKSLGGLDNSAIGPAMCTVCPRRNPDEVDLTLIMSENYKNGLEQLLNKKIIDLPSQKQAFLR